ncbi:Coiled-coil domain-containing protein [Pseudolycoriella hygida]|uniref:Coiled-coil domain-containing protein n=1 Tax=Pseudolycoriella hygida TaxID=35572 RepID=A0A9Q0MNY3_9DIPT|nr:Coiled-coil domain-containing protein [Pseudolycoriella hygida]
MKNRTMNDPNKRIDVNLSSLLSLKAELLRKHEEVSKAKSSHIVGDFVPRKVEKHSEKMTKSKNTTTTANNQSSESYEDSEMLNHSKKILEAKSKFYDKMSAMGGSLNSDDNCLVMFNQKKQIGEGNSRYESSSSDDSETETNDKGESGEWVEYTDCLGRTRKCLKEDVEFFKKKDGELAETVAERNKSNGISSEPSKWFFDTKGDFKLPMQIGDSKDDDTMSMMSKSSKIEEIRQNWEKQEAENVTKDYVHYQGVLFDEARTHGVGYYAFSTDESERAKQQKELEAIRLKTLASQKERENQRMSREKIIAERVKAAKNRQRARLGLPPLEDNPEPTEQEIVDKTAEEKRKKKEEKAKRKKEQLEQLKDSERKKHVRPWDKDKSGVLV